MTTTALFDPKLYSPDTFVPGVPFDSFKRLRREAPVFRQVSPETGTPFWVLSKYDDVVRVSQDSATFSSAQGTNIENLDGGTELMMLNMDPPRHTKLRNLISKGFTPKMVRAMEPHIREITNTIIDRVGRRGECDFVVDIAAELPLAVIAELIGVPHDEQQQIFHWGNQMVGMEDPEYGTTHETAMNAAMSMFGYAEQLAAKRREKAEDDLVSVLINAEVDGEMLTPLEFNVFFMLLAVAGNETTRNLTSHAMLALGEHPEQKARLLENPSLMPTAVEEMLRWGSVVMYFRRTTTKEVEIRGQRIGPGERVTMWYISANRDEDIFPDGDVFDVARSPNNHVAFGGGGAHFCLGASLARLEIRILFEELLRRLPDISLAGPPARLRSNFINGIKHLPVRFTPEARRL
jgi:cholest-4-en-3-one 26-monooxygenase